MAIELCLADSGDGRLEEEVALRFRVLRDPLGLPQEAVRFDFEGDSLHLLALEHERVVGCVLFHPRGSGGRLYQMAVDPSHQGRGLGRRLIQGLETELRARGTRTVELHAREPVVGFYQRLGYQTEGEPYIEVGLPHRHMHKTL